jgi:flagellar hook-associated protein 1 FlgK
MADIFSIGVSGLNAAQAGLLTTEHNISNVNTPGYNRQQIVQATNTPQYTGAGYMGQGVNVTTVKRVYDQFLQTQLLQQQNQSSQLNTYYTQIQQINNVIADPTTGLQSAIDGFYSALNGVANAPSSQAARQTLLGSAQSLANNFNSLGQLLTQINTSVNGQITSSVTSINAIAQQIAALNQAIVAAQGASNGQQPNDLLDQRDQLVSQLSQQIQTTVVSQPDGSYSLYIGDGNALVLGNQSYALKTSPSASDPSLLTVSYSTPGGTTIPIQSESLNGGVLGGLLAFQTQTLQPTQNTLGLLATGLATTINQQQQLGQDLNGALGTNLFTVGSPAVYSNSGNTGTAVISASISNASALTGSDYLLKYEGASGYTLTRLSDNTTTTLSSLPQTIDGMTINPANGTPAVGDSFEIRPTANGAQAIGVAITNTSQIAAAVPVIADSSLNNTGSGTIGQASVNGSPPPDPNLQNPVTITFTSPTTFDVSGTGAGLPATGVTYTTGAPISYNGWTVAINGSPNAGDVFTVGPNSNAANDGGNALLMAQSQTAQMLYGGTSSFEAAYAQLVSTIGNKTSELQATSQAQSTLVSQTQQAQQSLSGVNLDEEAANLIRYQQAYQAAGKAIQVANTMFDAILNIMP